MNPRAAINDLHPFQGCPFSHLGTSPNQADHIFLLIATRFWRIASGEDGIRTHAPFRTNGFQDRLVMTTSIPLQVCCGLLLQPNASVILAKMYTSVNMFFQTFFFFFLLFFYIFAKHLFYWISSNFHLEISG